MISDEELEMIKHRIYDGHTEHVEQSNHDRRHLFERLRSAEVALRFYSDTVNYSCVDHGSNCKSPESIVSVLDKGSKARAHFEKVKECDGDDKEKA